jgi:hypothetical protein
MRLSLISLLVTASLGLLSACAQQTASTSQTSADNGLPHCDRIEGYPDCHHGRLTDYPPQQADVAK